MKKLLLLGGSAQQVVAIETAKRLGYYTVLCDYMPDNPGQYVADKFYLVSTTDLDAVLDIAKKEQIDGILAYASDPAAPTAAYVAEKLGLPENPYESVNTMCHKDMLRAFLRENGFSVPKSEMISSSDEAKEISNMLCYPVIIKPVDSSGSKGVTVIYDEAGYKTAVEFAFSFSRCKRIIVEEYIEMNHPFLIGGDIFVIDGKVVLWGLMNCHRDQEVNPLVPVGKSYPLLLNDEQTLLVKQTLQQLVTKMGIRFGAMNVELIIGKNGKCYIIDAGPRAGGNMIPDLLGMIFKTDVVEMAVRTAMGESTVCCPNDQPQGYFATHNIHSKANGIFQRVEFDKEVEQHIVEKHIYKKQGDSASYFDNAAKAIGIIFFKFEDQIQQQAFLNDVNNHVKVVLQ